MKEHKLKVKPDYLENICNGKKKSEVRLNDRDFQCGDIVYLYDYSKLQPDKEIKSYDKASCSYKITHIHSGLGMADNYVVLSFKKC
jgi:ASC-1-like (ASCH) protein